MGRADGLGCTSWCVLALMSPVNQRADPRSLLASAQLPPSGPSPSSPLPPTSITILNSGITLHPSPLESVALSPTASLGLLRSPFFLSLSSPTDSPHFPSPLLCPCTKRLDISLPFPRGSLPTWRISHWSSLLDGRRTDLKPINSACGGRLYSQSAPLYDTFDCHSSP